MCTQQRRKIRVETKNKIMCLANIWSVLLCSLRCFEMCLGSEKVKQINQPATLKSVIGMNERENEQSISKAKKCLLKSGFFVAFIYRWTNAA